MAIYTQKCEQKWLKNNNRGPSNKDALGGKKSKNSGFESRDLALKIFKTINVLNPSFMKSIFSPKLNTKVRPNDILIKTCKSVTFEDKSLATLRP